MELLSLGQDSAILESKRESGPDPDQSEHEHSYKNLGCQMQAQQHQGLDEHDRTPPSPTKPSLHTYRSEENGRRLSGSSDHYRELRGNKRRKGSDCISSNDTYAEHNAHTMTASPRSKGARLSVTEGMAMSPLKADETLHHSQEEETITSRPVFACPFINDNTMFLPAPNHTSLVREDRTDSLSSISSEMGISGSGSGSGRRDTNPSILSTFSTPLLSHGNTLHHSSFSSSSSSTNTLNPSSSSTTDISGLYHIKPFPQNLPTDIIHLILDHVLGNQKFGQNGRWKDRKGQEEDKRQMVKAMKRSAAIHLKFSLIHRSWTPHVLKRLWRTPHLTSKKSIEHFSWCINNPLKLWGTEEMMDGSIGGVIGDRKRLVKVIKYCVGGGRQSASDYLKYSGAWFSSTADAIVIQLSNARGWECEGWCSKGCEEIRVAEALNRPLETRVVLNHLSILRSPLPADVFVLTLTATVHMQALELLDVQKEFVSGENLALIKKGLAHAEGIQAFAMKVDGVVEQEGSMSDVLELMPALKHLSLQADLLSLAFFEGERPEKLQSVLFGLASRPVVLFEGKAALDKLWEEGRAENIYLAARKVFSTETSVFGTLTHSMNVHSPLMHINPPSGSFLQQSSTSSMQMARPTDISGRQLTGTTSSNIPQLGLESWLCREFSRPNSGFSQVAIQGSAALDLYAQHIGEFPIPY